MLKFTKENFDKLLERIDMLEYANRELKFQLTKIKMELEDLHKELIKNDS